MLRNFTMDSAVTVAGNVTGTAYQVDRSPSACIAAVFAGGGSPVGVWKIQASLANVTLAADIPSTSWGDVSGSSTTIAADGCYLNDIALTNYVWIRNVYTRTSGTGTITTTYNENEQKTS